MKLHEFKTRGQKTAAYAVSVNENGVKKFYSMKTFAKLFPVEAGTLWKVYKKYPYPGKINKSYFT